MTRQYTDMNQHDALYNAAREYPGGIEALAQRMGMSANVLRSKLAPGVKTHHITFEEASRIVEFLVEAKVDCALQPLLAMNWRHHLVAYPLPQTGDLKDDELVTGIFDATRELGDVVRVVQESLRDDTITAAENDRTEKEINELMNAVVRVRAMYRERFDRQGTPGPRVA